MPNYPLCRRAKQNAIGQPVFILPDQEGGPVLPGTLTEVVPGRHYARFVVRLNDGQGSIRVHPAAVCIEPIVWLRDRPLYAGDEVYAHSPRHGIEKVRVERELSSSVVHITVLIPNSIFCSGSISLSALYWSESEAPKTATITPSAAPRPAVGAAQGLLARDKFINLYESLPNGSRLIPGSMVFYSVADAANAKHSAPHLGTFKLTPAS
jgi:hypothetical protein